jgi:hypothetical protein
MCQVVAKAEEVIVGVLQTGYDSLPRNVDDFGVRPFVGEYLLARTDHDDLAILDGQSAGNRKPFGHGDHFPAGEDDIGMRIPSSSGHSGFLASCQHRADEGEHQGGNVARAWHGETPFGHDGHRFMPAEAPEVVSEVSHGAWSAP